MEINNMEEGSNQWPKNRPLILRVKDYLSYHYDFRNNLIANVIEYKSKKDINWRELNDNDLFCELQGEGFKVSGNLLNAILQSSYVMSYDPIREYFETLPSWDSSKPDYIDQLFGYLYVSEEDRLRCKIQFKKALVRMASCALGQCVNKQALIFQGNQNDGKTHFCRFLVPPRLADYQKEELAPDKDGRLELCSNFIINLDEIGMKNKQEVDQLKSLFTLDIVKERRPYERRSRPFKRRASFVGTTDKLEFLTDEAGSVRWVCIPTNGVNFNYRKGIDIDMVYAQAYSLLLSGFEYQLTREELIENENANREFRVVTNEANLIQQYFSPSDDQKGRFMTSTDMLRELQQLVGNTIRLNSNNVGRALRLLGYQRISKRIGDNSLKGYYVIENDISRN